jgi:hypothetical protein
MVTYLQQLMEKVGRKWCSVLNWRYLNILWEEFIVSIKPISFTGLRRWCIDITLTILDFIHCPFFYLKHSVSETRFCLHLQAEPSQCGPEHRAGPEALRIASIWWRTQNATIVSMPGRHPVQYTCYTVDILSAQLGFFIFSSLFPFLLLLL